MSLRPPRDHDVRLSTNDYSPQPSAIGRLIEVAAGLERVRVTCGGQSVASHRRRWTAHQTLTGPAHEQAAGDLRHPAPSQLTEVQRHDPADYDGLFGLVDTRKAAL